MSRALAVCWLWLSIALPLHAQAPESRDLVASDFAFGRELQLSAPSQPLAAVEIPADVYRDSRSPDLQDVCVFNAQGKQVPHALLRAAAPPPAAQTEAAPVPFFPIHEQHASAPLELSVSISRAADGQVLALQSQSRAADKPGEPAGAPQPVAAYVLDVRSVPDARQGVSAARFSWQDPPDNLILPLQVESSNDLITWQPLAAEGGLLHLSHAGQRIEHDRVQWSPVQAAFLRVKPLDRRSFPAQLAGVRVEPAPATPAPQRLRVEVIAGAGSDPARGLYRFDLGGEIPVEELELQLPEDNSVIAGELWSAQRAGGPYQRLSEARFYRVASQERPLIGPRLRVFRQRARYYELRVDRSRVGIGAGMPTLITYHAPEQLLFLLRGGAPFSLAYGRHDVRRQRFEPEELLGLLPARPDGGLQAPAPAQLGPRRSLGGEQLLEPPKAPPPYKTYVLWGVLIAGVGLLGWLAYKLARSDA